MSKTRKVQVTLEEDQYAALERIARRESKKLAAVVRESIEKYCVAPEAEEIKRKALEDLTSLEDTPVPKDYPKWKRDYGDLKTKRKKKKH